MLGKLDIYTQKNETTDCRLCQMIISEAEYTPHKSPWEVGDAETASKCHQ